MPTLETEHELQLWSAVLQESLRDRSIDGAIQDADKAVAALRERLGGVVAVQEPEDAVEQCPGYESATIGRGWCKHCARMPEVHP